MPYLIKRINNKIKRDGLSATAWHACRTLPRRAAELSVNLKRRYDIVKNLPKLINSVKDELSREPAKFFEELRRRTLTYIESNHISEVGLGAYSYKLGGRPVLYASCCAALTKHLYGDLNHLSDSERKEWISFIQSFQSDDGLFRDPLIDIPLAEEIDWWGWRHLTLHVLMALTALDAVADRPFTIIRPFKKRGFMAEWLSSRRWHVDPASVSNEIQNYATFLQYTRDFQKEEWCNDALQEMYDWLDKAQDPETGLWGSRFNNPILLSNGVQTGYHLWLLYFYDMRPLKHIERIIDSCLKTQNPNGGFGVPLNSSACEDIDSIDPLVRLKRVTDYRRIEIDNSLIKALPWILVNVNADGGWVFRRYEALQLFHPAMRTGKNESNMLYTWFRTLALAYLAQALDNAQIPAKKWRFIECPGHQFWKRA